MARFFTPQPEIGRSFDKSQPRYNIPIEVGGGVRCLEDIRTLLSDIGARHVIVGTLAVEQPGVLDQAFAEFGESIIVGIDARGSEVAIRGWTDASRVDAFELARRVADAGARRIIYTDIARDGRLEGPNLEMTARAGAQFRPEGHGLGGRVVA